MNNMPPATIHQSPIARLRCTTEWQARLLYPTARQANHLRRASALTLLLILVLQVLPLTLSQAQSNSGNGPLQASPTPCGSQYQVTAGTGAIVPGTTDIGNHADDAITMISLPFPYQLYNATFTTANVDS